MDQWFNLKRVLSLGCWGWIVFCVGCAHGPQSPKIAEAWVRVHTLRLKPGEDLVMALEKYVQERQIRAGAIVTTVGSLRSANLRYANRPKGVLIQKDLEIVGLVGTVSVNGCHLHLTVSGPRGETVGGHALVGSQVRTTAEIVLNEYPDRSFVRELDPLTGYPELVIRAP